MEPSKGDRGSKVGLISNLANGKVTQVQVGLSLGPNCDRPNER